MTSAQKAREWKNVRKTERERARSEIVVLECISELRRGKERKKERKKEGEKERGKEGEKERENE